MDIRNGKVREVVAGSGYRGTYDGHAGNPTTIVRGGRVSETSTFSSDARDQLTAVSYQAPCLGPGDPFIRWSYDAVGNRLSAERPAGTTTFTYDDGDQSRADPEA